MDDLRFYVLFNSISVISGRWTDDNKRMYVMEPPQRLRRFLPRAELEPGTARSVGQRFTHRATGTPTSRCRIHDKQYRPRSDCSLGTVCSGSQCTVFHHLTAPVLIVFTVKDIRRIFFLPKNPKDLDPSYKTDLDL